MKAIDWLLVTAVWLVIAGVSFIGGAYMAYYLDIAESKLPSVWETAQATNLPIGQLEVKDNQFQSPQSYIEQPAYNITKLDLNAEL